MLEFATFVMVGLMFVPFALDNGKKVLAFAKSKLPL